MYSFHRPEITPVYLDSQKGRFDALFKSFLVALKHGNSSDGLSIWRTSRYVRDRASGFKIEYTDGGKITEEYNEPIRVVVGIYERAIALSKLDPNLIEVVEGMMQLFLHAPSERVIELFICLIRKNRSDEYLYLWNSHRSLREEVAGLDEVKAAELFELVKATRNMSFVASFVKNRVIRTLAQHEADVDVAYRLLRSRRAQPGLVGQEFRLMVPSVADKIKHLSSLLVGVKDSSDDIIDPVQRSKIPN